jgi:hypothetical protein
VRQDANIQYDSIQACLADVKGEIKAVKTEMKEEMEEFKIQNKEVLNHVQTETQ